MRALRAAAFAGCLGALLLALELRAPLARIALSPTRPASDAESTVPLDELLPVPPRDANRAVPLFTDDLTAVTEVSFAESYPKGLDPKKARRNSGKAEASPALARSSSARSSCG